MLPPFGWSAVLTQWQFAPVVTVLVAVFAGLYCWGVVRVARRHPARPWPAWRTGMFLGGLAVIVIATESGVGTYDDLLFWDHMVQHLLLIMVAPPLLIFGQPMTLLMHASRNPLHTWVKRAFRSMVASFPSNSKRIASNRWSMVASSRAATASSCCRVATSAQPVGGSIMSDVRRCEFISRLGKRGA